MGDEALSGVFENGNFSKAFSEILSNPEMLSTISSMAQKLKESNSQNEKKEEPTVAEEASETPASSPASLAGRFPELIGMLSGQNSGAGKNRRSELLCALKPYLSQSRVDAIDQIIKLSEISSVFKNLS